MVTNPKKPTTARSATRQAVLEALRAAFPDPVGPDAMFRIAGRPYPSRIGELRDRGWDIETGPEPIPSYRLVSMSKGPPDPTGWGLKARAGATTGLVPSVYGTSTVHLPDAIEARLLKDVATLVRAAFAEAGMQVPGEPEGVKERHLQPVDEYAQFGAEMGDAFGMAQDTCDEEDPGYEEDEDLAAYRAWHDDCDDDDDEEG